MFTFENTLLPESTMNYFIFKQFFDISIYLKCNKFHKSFANLEEISL